MDELGSEVSSTFEDNNTTRHEMISKINSQTNNNLINNQISIKISEVQNSKRQINNSYLDNNMFHINSQREDNNMYQRHQQQHQLKVEWSPRRRRTAKWNARRGDRRWFTTMT